MPQVEARGEVEQVKQRLKSLLNSSGLQVFGEAPDSLRFRKVRLTPSRRLPLSICGSGIIKFERSERGSTAVTYGFSTSPATVFSFAVTGLSIVIFAAFVDYLLLASPPSLAGDVTVAVLVVTLASSLVILVLIMSFLGTKRRAEKFLRAFLKRSSDLSET